MRVSKLLYIADTEERDPAPGIIEKIIPFQQKGLEEIVFFKVNPSEEQIESLSRLSINSKVLTDHAISSEDILRVAEEEKISLIVIKIDKEKENTRPRSVLKKLIEISSTPLLVINEDEKEKESQNGLFDHVIFATACTPRSEKTVKFILGFKELVGELDIIHVINGKITVKYMRDLKERLEKTRKVYLDEGIDAESHIYAGKTDEEIITASRDYRGTIIIISVNTERSFLRRMFKESSAYGTVKRANMPVLIVP